MLYRLVACVGTVSAYLIGPFSSYENARNYVYPSTGAYPFDAGHFPLSTYSDLGLGPGHLPLGRRFLRDPNPYESDLNSTWFN